MTKTIIFDLLGNDNGIKAGVQAAIKFVKNFIDYKVLLVGDKEEILKFTSENEKIEIFHSPNQVTKNIDNLSNIHKEDNSMNNALRLLKENRGFAVLSSGDSGKYLISSMMILKKISNNVRPAFMSIIPTKDENKKFILLDEGANLNITGDYLVQWAKLGTAFSKNILKVSNPKVGILNIGTEDYKGFEYHQDADKILKETNNDFEYIGFIESRYLLEGKCDVVVADGYAGNITLKALEGTVLSFSKIIKKQLTKNFWRKMFALFLKSSFNDIKEHLDYRNVGAAWIIGVNGIVIKAHGSSDEKAYYGALNQIRLAIESNALEEFKKAL